MGPELSAEAEADGLSELQTINWVLTSSASSTSAGPSSSEMSSAASSSSASFTVETIRHRMETIRHRKSVQGSDQGVSVGTSGLAARIQDVAPLPFAPVRDC